MASNPGVSCDVCGTWGAAVYPLASRVHPLCEACYLAWYEGLLERRRPVVAVVMAAPAFNEPRDDLGRPVTA